jgi:alanyl-tRNA synthetase
MLNNAPNVMNSIQKLIAENEQFKEKIDGFQKKAALVLEKSFIAKLENKNDIYLLKTIVEDDPNILKDIAFKLRNQHENTVLALGTIFENKPHIILAFSDNMAAKGLNASNIVREAAKLIQGGGGGQPFLATAGGKDCQGIESAMDKILEMVEI